MNSSTMLPSPTQCGAVTAGGCFENKSNVFSETGNETTFPAESMSRRLQVAVVHDPDMGTTVYSGRRLQRVICGLWKGSFLDV